ERKREAKSGPEAATAKTVIATARIAAGVIRTPVPQWGVIGVRRVGVVNPWVAIRRVAKDGRIRVSGIAPIHIIGVLDYLNAIVYRLIAVNDRRRIRLHRLNRLLLAAVHYVRLLRRAGRHRRDDLDVRIGNSRAWRLCNRLLRRVAATGFLQGPQPRL